MNQRPDRDAGADRRARLIEVGVSVLFSALASAGVASWSLSATMATYAAKFEETERRLAETKQQISAIELRQLAQERQIATSDAHYNDILRRLDSIDEKLEKRF